MIAVAVAVAAVHRARLPDALQVRAGQSQGRLVRPDLSCKHGTAPTRHAKRLRKSKRGSLVAGHDVEPAYVSFSKRVEGTHVRRSFRT